jgi:serine/threonine protein kinase
LTEKKTIGSYTLAEQIGEGGMATIYKAKHEILNRDVAIKKLKSPSKEATSRFHKEARLSAKLNHENVVSIYDFVKDARSQYLIMEYIDGIDLRSILEFESPLPPVQAARIVLQIAMGLEFAHLRGIIHRDIKPSNVLLSKGGEAKIIDFGVAKDSAPTQLTQVGIIIGTPSYMSPEYCNGEELTRQSDVYSLGVVFYELITGFKPFVAPSNNELLIAITRGKYKAPRRYNKAIPIKMQRIVKRMMHMNLNKRYDNMSEVVRVIERFLKDESLAENKSGLQLYFGELMEKKKANKYRKKPSTHDKEAGDKPKIWRKYAIGFATLLIVTILGFAGFAYLRDNYFAKLQIESNATTGKVILDDSVIGELENGRFYGTFIRTERSYLRVVSGEKYPQYERLVNLNPGETKYIKINENPLRLKAKVTFDTVPQGARIYLDNKLIGYSPLKDRNIVDGKRKITYRLPGYKTHSQFRDFKVQERLSLIVEMERE